MLYTYAECIKKYKNDYGIKKALDNKELFKFERGLYGDDEFEKNGHAYIQKKYPGAIYTLDSALFFHDLTNNVPQYDYLITDKDASKIKDKRVKQSFDNCNSLGFGIETINYNSEDIRVFNKERMLVELIRNRNKYSLDYYKEVINNYRQIIYDLNIQEINDYIDRLPKSKLVGEIFLNEVL